ncbi:MAG: PHP domain-containing protein [Clostridiales bacterium]|nr:PHP domain-containing protein [Clostridiales bacterium]MBR6700385.1 PHP domain-containing protein [Bacillota bacterium]
MDRIKWDYHTHTVYSHGKGSIEDNVKVAVKKGLTRIAISDHGPGHISYGIKRAKIKEMRKDIESIKHKYPEIEILLGVEANVINRSGALDITDEEWELFDIVMAGYHYGAFGEKPGHDFGIHAKNLVMNSFRTSTPKIKAENTDLMVKAVYENDLLAITHPGAKYDIYIAEVAKACAEKGVWMEINNSHPFLTAQTIAESAEYDVTFVIGSDAHVPHKVGNCERAVERLNESGVDRSRVINLL